MSGRREAPTTATSLSSRTYTLEGRIPERGAVGGIRVTTSGSYNSVPSSGYGLPRTSPSTRVRAGSGGSYPPTTGLSNYNATAPSVRPSRVTSTTAPREGAPATSTRAVSVGSRVTKGRAPATGYLARSSRGEPSVYTPSSSSSTQRRGTPIDGDTSYATSSPVTSSVPRRLLARSDSSSSNSSCSSDSSDIGRGREYSRGRSALTSAREQTEGTGSVAEVSTSGSVKRSSSSRRPSVKRAETEAPAGSGVKGLTNLGNTCFMNSILQCLMAIPEVVQHFYNAKLPSCSSVSAAFADLVTNVWGGRTSGGSFSPRAFLREVSRKDRRWAAGKQHDSQEFLHFLLEAMQTELNRVKGKPKYQELKGQGTEEEQAAEAWEYARKWNDSIIDDIFGGLLQSTVECRSCQHPSNCFDKFLDLSIPIPSRSSCTITDCLASFTEVESLGKQDGYRCEKCKCNVSATKQLQIYHPPNILMLHLKRFSSSSAMGRFSSLSKNNGSVRLTLKGLDLAPFCNSLGIKNSKSTLYDLIGVSNHSGSLGAGHYTAICQNFKNRRWYHFNDSHTSEDSGPAASSTSAYVVIYRRRDC